MTASVVYINAMGPPSLRSMLHVVYKKLKHVHLVSSYVMKGDGLVAATSETLGKKK